MRLGTLDDDAARLVAADAFEEQGDARGEYLRLEMKLRHLSPMPPSMGWCVRLTAYDSALGGYALKAVRELDALGLKAARELVISVNASHHPIVSSGLRRDEAEADRRWLQRVPGTVARVEWEGAAPMSEFDATWDRLATLSEALDADWLRSVGRLHAVRALGVLDDELLAHVDALAGRVRPSARGLLFGAAHGLPIERDGCMVRDGLSLSSAQALVEGLRARTPARFAVEPSRCLFAFPAVR